MYFPSAKPASDAAYDKWSQKVGGTSITCAHFNASVVVADDTAACLLAGTPSWLIRVRKHKQSQPVHVSSLLY